jgi:hypothetical protein
MEGVTRRVIGIVTGGALLASGVAAFPQTPEVIIARSVVRTTGQPVTVEDTFTVCDDGGQFSLVVDNGPGGDPKVSSGTIYINGVEVIRDADLNQQVPRIERHLTGILRTNTLNTLEVRLGSQPGGTIGLSVLAVQACGPQVRFTSPASGAVLHDPALVVEGEITAHGGPAVSLTMEVTLAGQAFDWPLPVALSGGRFAARVPLVPGPNRLVARVSDLTGRSAEATLLLTFEPDPPEYDRAPEPDVRPTSGFAPLDVTFGAGEAADPTVTVVDLDVDGDGMPEFRRADFAPPPHRIVHTYLNEGLYVATLVVQDQTGRSQVTRVPIHVIPVPDLAVIWNDFRAALGRRDVDGALLWVAAEARARYRRVLTDLQGDLPGIAAALGTLTTHVVTPEYATASVSHSEPAGLATYLVTFVRDGDGVWRIASL